MPFGDSTPLIYTLIGVIVLFAVWVFMDFRDRTLKRFANHEERLGELEDERTDIAVMKTDLRYIKEAVDELRGKKR